MVFLMTNDTEVIASMDGCGLLTYMGYKYDRKIINLDGVVNSEVVSHLKNRTLQDYVCKLGVRYVAHPEFGDLTSFNYLGFTNYTVVSEDPIIVMPECKR